MSGIVTLHTPVPTRPSQRCLEIDDLVAMVDGSLDTSRSELVLGHVDRCAQCAEVIANLGSLDGPARRVGRYQIERLLGTGGMGIVYTAFDPELQRRVAIKLVRPDSTNDAYQALILKEARTLARVNHPNVVAVYDVGEHDGEVYLASEFIDGVTLADWQPQRGTAAVVGAWVQVSRGLAAAHAEGVVHRDVKPANVFVGRDGRVRIGDFGIAHRAPIAEPVVADDALPPTGPLVTNVVAGTPAYMAPEQREGRVDARSDQFSTCVAITEALTGARPSAGDVVVLEPAALGVVLTRGLRNDPEQRFSSMDVFADALAKAIAPPPRRRGMYIAAAGALAAVAGGVAVLGVVQSGATDACRVETAAKVWSPARRDALVKVLPVDMGSEVDGWLVKWTAASRDVCVTADPKLRALRASCLARALGKLDKTLAAWEANRPRRVLSLHVDMESLPHAAWCSAQAVTLVGEPSAEALAIEAELDAGGADLAKLRPRAHAAGYAPVVRAIAITAAARQQTDDERRATLRAALDDGPDDFSKIQLQMTLMQFLSGDTVGEAERLAETARTQLAALGGDAEMEAELDYRLAYVLGRTERLNDSIALFERSRQGMRNAYGEGSPFEANVLIALTGAYYKRDNLMSKQARETAKDADKIWDRHKLPIPSVLIATSPRELVEQVERMAQVSREMYGTGLAEAANVEYARMNAYTLAGEDETALKHALAARDLTKQLGDKSTRVSFVHNQIAGILIDLNRAKEALPYAHDAVAHGLALGFETETAHARATLGRALIETGDIAAARKPLEDALTYMKRTNEPARVRGRTRFLLAKARYAKEPKKAIADAQVARAELEAFFATDEADPTKNPTAAAYLREIVDRRIADIDAWLAKRVK